MSVEIDHTRNVIVVISYQAGTLDESRLRFMSQNRARSSAVLPDGGEADMTD